MEHYRAAGDPEAIPSRRLQADPESCRNRVTLDGNLSTSASKMGHLVQ